MSVISPKTRCLDSDLFRIMIMLSAWGFALVITSFLFLWLGHLLDELLGTAPKFMLGLFFLAIIGCFIEIYQEVSTIIRLNL
ncbi:MAG: AtpZ/AtpI family protein [Smithella sp.]